ncbi:GNAT family N-acetyltransferase [Chondromyces crocatus]|nr:GNAT family N-acetyltransferase [Chondromyces crocatus]
MQEPTPPDQVLARRIESAEAAAGVWCHEALSKLRPGAISEIERVAGGVLAFCGPRSPLTQGRGLGMAGPVTENEVDRIEHFFRHRGVDAALQLSPYADPTLVEALSRRGFTVTLFLHALTRPLPSLTAQPPPPGVEVRRVDPADAGVWARLVAQGFAEHGEVTPEAVELNQLLFHAPQATCFWAFLDGRPVGGGAMATHDGLASLFGMATLPEARRRGVQRALLEARLAHAASSGCAVASVVTLPGTTSQRNAERAGFTVAYTRVMLSKRWC